MFEELNNCQKVMKENLIKPLQMTKQDEVNFKKATHCHICEIKYKPKEEPVGDHCHITGKYCRSARNDCNLKLQISAEKIKIPIIFHNQGYDSHLIIEQLGEYINEKAKLDLLNEKLDLLNEKKEMEKNFEKIELAIQ